MIFAPITGLIFPYLNSLLDLIPTIDINIYGGYLDKFIEYLSFATYILPLEALFPILKIIIFLTIFRIIVALARLIIELIPIL